MVIEPTIGRKVWFWTGDPEQKQAQDATICYIFGTRMVNLRVTDHQGVSRPETSVALWQDGDPQPLGRHAQWMPFQVGQAKAIAAEKFNFT